MRLKAAVRRLTNVLQLADTLQECSEFRRGQAFGYRHALSILLDLPNPGDVYARRGEDEPRSDSH
jgi:hypothetical protein